MKVSLIPGRELSDDLVRVWLGLQRANADLASPYFHPEFTNVIAASRDDVEVAVLESAGKIVAFFPFQREHGAVGRPVGGIISDYQGIICGPNFTCDPCELVGGCRLKAWDFDHLLASQSFFRRFHHSIELSPQLDLSQGFETYYRQQRSARSEQIKIRSIQREFGPLRFVAHSALESDLEQIIGWKSQQYAKTGASDIFLCSWIKGSVHRIHATQLPDFAGVLSVLYSGDRLVAGHFGMRAGSLLHSWFPAYDPHMAKYSPGLLLLLKMAEHAPGAGIRTIDLGKGINEYKQRFMNASCQLANGSVELLSMRWLRRTVRRKLRSMVGQSFPAVAATVRQIRRRT
jgi:CelD/BcsL family acetyltransferase involved in cellulose biosynthesis